MTKKEELNDIHAPPTQEVRELPVAITKLIDLSNRMLSDYQQKLYADIELAAADMMQHMNINPEDGWRLDLSQRKFVRFV